MTLPPLSPPSPTGQRLHPALTTVAVVVGVAVLEWVRHRDFLVFHSLVEMVAITIAGGTFLLTWSARRSLDNAALLVLGLALGGVALIDLLHTLTYSGMRAAGGSDPNLATQLWVAARLFQTAAMAAAVLVAGRSLRTGPVATILLVVAGLLLASIRPWRIFPDCHVLGRLTGFKVGAEGIICLLLIAVAIGLVWQRRHFNRRVLVALLLATGLTIVSEILFTLYVGPYDVINALGHYIKFAAFLCVYQAIIATTVGEPSQVLYQHIHRQKEAYQAERNRLCTILDSLVDPVCIINADRRIEYVNAAMAERFGPLGPATDCHRYLRGQPACCDDCNLATILVGDTRRREVQIDDTTYDVLETTITNVDGSTAKLSVYHDVTEIRQAMVALAASELKYRTLFEGMLDGFALHEIVTDAAGRPIDYRFLEVNEAFTHLTGLPREAIQDRRVTEVIPGIEHDPADWIGRYGRVALEGRKDRFEQYATGLDRWFAVSAYAAGNGRFCAVFRDISERKQHDQDMVEHQQRLAGALDDLAMRTAQLQRANQELQAFASMVSHDLRAPLRIVCTYADLLQEDLGDRLDPQITGHLNGIIAVTERMDRLIDDIRELTRIDRSELHLETVDLGALARDCLDELRGLEPGRRVDVTIAHDLQATADRQLTRILLMNLLGNAWKYTGGVPDARLTLDTQVEGSATVFRISDNGVGFPPDLAEKIFDPFVRAHDGHTFPGSGIGLAICARIVLRHGGSIRAWSDGRAGATVTFSLGRMQGVEAGPTSPVGEVAPPD